MSASDAVGTRRGLVLTAMIFAVAMTFIDQTIVSIAAPKIQSELGLTSTGIQWSINAYLLAMAALFAFGGRLADTVGDPPDGGDRHRRLRLRLGDVRPDPDRAAGRRMAGRVPGRCRASAAR